MKSHKLLPILGLLSLLLLAISSNADEAPGAKASPAPEKGGKNVRTKIEPNKPQAKAVGVRAQDPSQNGRTDTSGSASLSNASNMGVGLQFDLNPPKSTKPKEPKKADSAPAEDSNAAH